MTKAGRLVDWAKDCIERAKTKMPAPTSVTAKKHRRVKDRIVESPCMATDSALRKSGWHDKSVGLISRQTRSTTINKGVNVHGHQHLALDAKRSLRRSTRGLARAAYGRDYRSRPPRRRPASSPLGPPRRALS